MRRRVSEELKPMTTPLWFISFADMVTLLLGFFIALVSFSTLEVSRFKAVLGSIKVALHSPFAATPPSNNQIIMTYQEQLQIEDEAIETASEVRGLAEKSGFSTEIMAEATPEGVKISLSNPIVFDEGSDELKPEITGFLSGIAGIIRQRGPEGVLIEGHTDDTPIHTERFPSNWELSAARALGVLRLFQADGVPADKLAAVGFGEYRPKVALPKGAAAALKSMNRRVEIILQLHTRPGGLIPPNPAQAGDEVR